MDTTPAWKDIRPEEVSRLCYRYVVICVQSDLIQKLSSREKNAWSEFCKKLPGRKATQFSFISQIGSPANPH
jgi:hypothetical protein